MGAYLITGSAGFIGSHVARMLLDDGHQVIGIDGYRAELYPADDKIRRHADLDQFERFESHVLDLRTDSIRAHLDGVEAVIHLAALAGIETSNRLPEAYLQHNVDATRNVLNAMTGTDAHLVHASTSSVYGATAVGDETLPIAPVSAYGRSKVAAETLVRNYTNESNGSATILRLFSVYGPEQRPEMAYAAACRALLQRRPMTITGDGTQSRTNTYVSDVARAIVLAVEAKPQSTLNIAGGESIRLIEAIEILARELDVEPMLTFGPARPGDQVETRGDSTLAGQVLGWRPQVTIGEGLAAQAAWTRALFARQGTR